MPSFNTYPYNSAQFNSKDKNILLEDSSAILTDEKDFACYYNNFSFFYDLGDGNKMCLTEYPDRDMATRGTTMFERPLNDGMGFISSYGREKTVTLKGRVEAPTADDFEAQLMLIKQALSQPNGNLDIKNRNYIYRYKATIANAGQIFDRGKNAYNIDFANFDFTFRTTGSPEDIVYTDTTFSNKTDLNSNEQITNEGFLKSEAVLIIIVINSANAITKLELENETDSRLLVIEESLSANDILIIDTKQNEVTLNGVTLTEDVNGQFPIMILGNNLFNFNFTGTSIDYDVTIKYKKTYP